MGKTATSKRLDNKGKIRLLKSWLNYFSEHHPRLFEETAATHISLFCAAVINERSLTLVEGTPLVQAILAKDPKRQAAIWNFIKVV